MRDGIFWSFKRVALLGAFFVSVFPGTDAYADNIEISQADIDSYCPTNKSVCSIAVAGDYILTEDVAFSKPLHLRDNVNLYLEGNTLTAPSVMVYTGVKNVWVENGVIAGNLTVSGAEAVDFVDVSVAGDKTIEKGSKVTFNGGDYRGGDLTVAGSELVIDNGQFDNLNFGYGAYVEINDGEFDNTGKNNNLFDLGTLSDNAALKITGGSFKSDKSVVLFNAGDYVTILDGDFEGEPVVYVGGVPTSDDGIEISDGYFKSNDDSPAIVIKNDPEIVEKITIGGREVVSDDPDSDTIELGGGDEAETPEEMNPESSDEPGGDEPGGDEPGGDQPGGDEPGGDEPGGDQPGGDEPGGDEPGGDQPGGDKPGGDEPGGDQPGGDEPGGDQPGGDEPGGDQPGGDEPGGDQPGGDEPGGDEPGGDQPGGDQPGGDEPGGDEPGGDQPGGDQPGGDEPGGDEPGGDQPGGDQPGGDEPGGDQPGGDEPGGDEPGGDEPGGDEPGAPIDSTDPTNPSNIVDPANSMMNAFTPDTGKAPVMTNDYAEAASFNEVIDFYAVLLALLIAVKFLKWYNKEYEKEGFNIWDYYCSYRGACDIYDYDCSQFDED